MTIRFILNGEDVVASVEANKRLAVILRENFSFVKTKSGCLSGTCGACSVIFNGAVSPSCLIPAFKVQGGEIITLEGFSQTDEYQDIVAGFAGAGVENCGCCDAGKILAAELLLEKNTKPDREDFYNAFSGVRCRCTEPERLYAGILSAIEIRRRRIYGRSS
ncbi:MAG: aldehyde oxidoreductase [Treponema sp.]|nr:aldehyde oxidoreductase [Treponema sp.]